MVNSRIGKRQGRDTQTVRESKRLLRWQSLTDNFEDKICAEFVDLIDVADASETIHYCASILATHAMRQEVANG